MPAHVGDCGHRRRKVRAPGAGQDLHLRHDQDPDRDRLQRALLHKKLVQPNAPKKLGQDRPGNQGLLPRIDASPAHVWGHHNGTRDPGEGDTVDAGATSGDQDWASRQFSLVGTGREIVLWS